MGNIGIKIKPGVFICGGITMLTFIYLSVSGIYLFFNTRLIEEKVENVKTVFAKKKTYITLKLLGDENIYYQLYQDRFQDLKINQIKKGDIISFYTTFDKFKIDKPILASEEFTQFEYYPIYNVNGTKNIFHFISYYLFGSSWINIIFYFSSAGMFFYLIPYVVKASLPRRLFLIAIIGIWIWLFLLG